MEKWYANKTEREAVDVLEGVGYVVSKTGWPDFFCLKEINGITEAICVEIKADTRYGPKKLSTQQWGVINVLMAHGVDCYRWTPKTGLKRARPDVLRERRCSGAC